MRDHLQLRPGQTPARPTHGIVDSNGVVVALLLLCSTLPTTTTITTAIVNHNRGNIVDMTTFEDFLQQLDELLDETPDHVLRANRGLIKSVCKKLNKSQGSSALSLLEALEFSRKTIEDFTELPIERAVVCSVNWAGVDLRVHDIRLGATQHDQTTKFRKGLGERSLALQYHEWEMREFGCSRLGDLRRDPANCKDVADGNIVKFITVHGLPKITCVEKGIQHGTKLLLLEYLFGMAGTSAILFFAFGKFRAVRYPEMRDLASSMRESAWIAELAQKIAPWFEDCCKRYKGWYGKIVLQYEADLMADETDSRKRKCSVYNEEEYDGPEHRSRRDCPTLASTTQLSSISNPIWLSHQTPVANFNSAQVPRALASTTLSTLLESSNNRSQNAEAGTPHVDGLQTGLPSMTRVQNRSPANVAVQLPAWRGAAPDIATTGRQAYGQPELSQWRSDTRSSWVQGTGHSYNPFHDPLTPALDQFNQAGTATVGTTIESSDQFPWDFDLWARGW